MNIINGVWKLFKKESKQTDSSEAPTIIPNSFLPDTETPVICEQLEHKIISDDIKRLTGENIAETDEADYSGDEVSDANDSHIAELNLSGQKSIEGNDKEELVSEEHHEISVIAPEETIIEKKKEQPSLLNNRIFIKLVEECVDIMNEFESFIDRVETDEGREMTQMIVRRLHESLERSGLSRIDDVKVPFSILLHNPEPMMPVADGESLEKVISPGLKIENRVFRKAKVQISVR